MSEQDSAITIVEARSSQSKVLVITSFAGMLITDMHLGLKGCGVNLFLYDKGRRDNSSLVAVLHPAVDPCAAAEAIAREILRHNQWEWRDELYKFVAFNPETPARWLGTLVY